MMTKEEVEDASGEGEQKCWFWRKRMPSIQRDGGWELERLLPMWGKFGHPLYGGQNWID